MNLIRSKSRIARRRFRVRVGGLTLGTVLTAAGAIAGKGVTLDSRVSVLETSHQDLQVKMADDIAQIRADIHLLTAAELQQRRDGK